MVTDSSLQPATYSKQSERFMVDSPTTQHVYSQYLFAKGIDAVQQVELDRDIATECSRCGDRVCLRHARPRRARRASAVLPLLPRAYLLARSKY
jgi:hypothetical protein